MNTIEAVCQQLRDLNISFQLIEHPAVYTMDDTFALGLFKETHICKNLFLKDKKTDTYFLVVLNGNSKANMKELSRLLQCKNLKFASEDQLLDILGLSKGAVTPLGIMNDSHHRVTVVVDTSLKPLGNLGFHPNDNRATVTMTYDDLTKFISHFKNPAVHFSSTEE